MTCTAWNPQPPANESLQFAVLELSNFNADLMRYNELAAGTTLQLPTWLVASSSSKLINRSSSEAVSLCLCRGEWSNETACIVDAWNGLVVIPRDLWETHFFVNAGELCSSSKTLRKQCPESQNSKQKIGSFFECPNLLFSSRFFSNSANSNCTYRRHPWTVTQLLGRDVATGGKLSENTKECCWFATKTEAVEFAKKQSNSKNIWRHWGGAVLVGACATFLITILVKKVFFRNRN